MSRFLAPAIALLTAVAHAENAAVYHEKYRPQVHFSPKKDWMNDPNGLIHLDGTYHMFFQHRKTKHWGHATSSDLLHWSEQPIALAPHEGHQVYSGCAVFDAKNTSGLGTAANPPLVAIYSSWGEGQCLAFSNDKSKTWSRYDQNPVLNLPDDEKKSYPLSARDPNVIWHPETNRWVMLLYQNVHRKLDPALPRDAQGGFGIFSSTNLKDWKFESHLPGFYVCPDIFELPVVSEPGVKKWVLMDWAQYGIGHFDGKRFTLESKPRKLDHGKNLSANQTWKNMPDGDSRRIQISWLRGGKYPGMPFDQQMSIPVELTLRRVGGELTLCKTPIRELSRLVDNRRVITPGKLSRDRAVEVKTDRHSLDIAIKLHLSTSSEALVEVLGQPIRITRDTIECMGSKAVWSDKSQALLDLRIITDRTSLEIFANGGATTMSFCLLAPDTPAPIRISTPKGSVDVYRLELGALKSIWSEQ